MNNRTGIYLCKELFTESEKLFLEKGELKVYTFRYPSGIEGLRFVNKRGEMVVLPFKGQQIWSMKMDGRDLQMKSMFDNPAQSEDYLSTYGAFFLHCGFTRMGVPTSPEDNHPLHGELPNARYQKAALFSGRDEYGEYMELKGEFRYTVAFNYNYKAEPAVRMYEDSGIVNVTMEVQNLRSAPMEYMYMGHINFRPVNGSKLIYSAMPDMGDVRVFVNIPEHMKSSREKAEKLRDFMLLLEKEPEKHEIIDPSQPYDPEIVFSIKYRQDNEGNAYTLQVQPDGYAHLAIHRPEQLPVGIRWIARNDDHDAMGMVLPATAEHKGYTAEKEKGNIKVLEGGKKVVFQIKAGSLRPGETDYYIEKINNMISSQKA